MGLAKSKVTRNDDGTLKSANYTSLKVNPKTLSTEIETGLAAPIKNNNGNIVGSMSTYGKYGGKSSYSMGVQLSGVFGKKDITKPTEQPNTKKDFKEENVTGDYDLDGNDNDELDEIPEEYDSVEIEEAEDIGASETIEQDEVNEELNKKLEHDNKQAAGGYCVKAEVGHKDSNHTAVTYDVEASAYINVSDNATIYGRVISTNGELDNSQEIYGSQLNNQTGSIRRVHGDEKFYNATQLTGKSNNTTSVGAGTVYSNPDKNLTAAAGAGMVVEDGSVTNISAGGKIEKTVIDNNDTLKYGADIMYNNNFSNDIKAFVMQMHYSNTFFDGKTTLIGGIGYDAQFTADTSSERVFLTTGICQEVIKNVDLYGQYEIGKISGCGSQESVQGYSALKLGTQYHFKVLGFRSAAFVEYDVTNGTSMTETQIKDNAKKRFGDGRITFGIGVNF